MPELPEVEAARRAIEDHCSGKKITRVIIADDNKVIDGISPSDFQNSIIGKTIVSARRKGKNLWLELDSPPFPSFQFGMAGAIYIKGVAVTKYKRSAVKESEEWPSKYSKFFVELDDGLEVSFTDKRRFAKVRLLANPVSVRPISELGPDALLEPMTVDEFATSLAKKKITIKPLLLDQVLFRVLGTGSPMKYCTKPESTRCRLLLASPKSNVKLCIHPSKRSFNMQFKSVPIAKSFLLNGYFIFGGGKYRGKLMVIEKAVEVDADSSQFPSNWIFHAREGKPGKAFVDGKKIDFITAGGRTTAYVPELQKLTGKDAEKATKVRPGKRGVKSKEDDGEEEAAQESEKENDSAKPKKGTKPRGRGKKPASKKKTEDSDDEDDDADGGDDSEAEEKVVKPIGRGTKPAIKRKPEEKAGSQAGKKPKGRKS